MSSQPRALRPPAESVYSGELARLADRDRGDRPPGWKLSPAAVRRFICGDRKLEIERKFYGDDVLVERAIVGLAGNRGLLLTGEPGTAKSMLSELLAAAISGCSTNTIQGSAGTTDDQIRYSWNYALLLAKGPCQEALVPSPLYTGIGQGVIVRFEEITRCPAEIQDILISVLSEKLLMVPELRGSESVLLAKPGFNVIGTANTRDRGVHEMSSALKRRFNFETVHPLKSLDLEVELVTRECRRLLGEAAAPAQIDEEAIAVLVTVFQDLREGRTAEAVPVERPSAVMSTAEAVAVSLSSGLDAFYYGNKKLTAESVARHLASAVLQDQAGDLAKLRHYFDVVVRERGEKSGGAWADLWKARKYLP